MTRSELNRVRLALGHPRVVTRNGLIKTELILDGRYCETSLVVPSTGRVVALKGGYLTAYEAAEIEGISSLGDDLVMGHRPNTVFQKSQAEGTGLIDRDGNVY